MLIIEGNAGKSKVLDGLSKEWDREKTIIVNITDNILNVCAGFKHVVIYDASVDDLLNEIREGDNKDLFEQFDRIVIYANCSKKSIFDVWELERQLNKKSLKEIVLTIQTNSNRIRVYKV